MKKQILELYRTIKPKKVDYKLQVLNQEILMDNSTFESIELYLKFKKDFESHLLEIKIKNEKENLAIDNFFNPSFDEIPSEQKRFSSLKANAKEVKELHNYKFAN